jgi:putative phosphoserine phosphatase / 1-acylglycerol-3-phosphate O-acyltransferase
MARAAAIFDLDRTVIAGSPAPVFQHHLAASGLTGGDRLPFAVVLDRLYEELGETWFTAQQDALRRRTPSGWSVEEVAEVAEAAADDLEDRILPYVPSLLDEHRSAGRTLVLATTAPEPLVRPFADRLGIDDVIATRWDIQDGHYTGRVDGPLVWGRAKAKAVRQWADTSGVALAQSYAFSDSYADAALLAAVGHPVAINPDPQLAVLSTLRSWPIRYLDVPEGVPKVLGREIQDWARPLMRPELVPYARFSFDGLEHVPDRGCAILAFNHRSYFDPTAMGLLAAKVGRPVRGLGKKEVFDAPLIGRLARMAGGIRVERASGSDEPLEQAAQALRGGELVMIAPQGTIPRGRAFFEPELTGRWGAARLAHLTGAPVIPVGIWGSERVWPRNARLPRLNPVGRPTVTVRVGPPVALGGDDVDADTRAIMAAIVDLLPDEARQRREPTEDELRRTFPPGYTGDPDAETDRRPGTDT